MRPFARARFGAKNRIARAVDAEFQRLTHRIEEERTVRAVAGSASLRLLYRIAAGARIEHGAVVVPAGVQTGDAVGHRINDIGRTAVVVVSAAELNELTALRIGRAKEGRYLRGTDLPRGGTVGGRKPRLSRAGGRIDRLLQLSLFNIRQKLIVDAETAGLDAVAPRGLGRKRAVRVDEVVDRQRELLHVVRTLHPTGRLARRLNGGKEQPNQDADDRDYDQQFDEGETASRMGVQVHFESSYKKVGK